MMMFQSNNLPILYGAWTDLLKWSVSEGTSCDVLEEESSSSVSFLSSLCCAVFTARCLAFLPVFPLIYAFLSSALVACVGTCYLHMDLQLANPEKSIAV